MSAADPVPVVGRGVRALRLFWSELMLTLGRRRNIAGLALLAAVPIVLAIAIRVSSPDGGRGPDFLAQISENGFFVALTSLSVMITFFLPLAVSALCGDAIASEANLVNRSRVRWTGTVSRYRKVP